MGAYSELDMELRHGGNPQESDNAFFEDDEEAGDGGSQTEVTPSPAPSEPGQTEEPPQSEAKPADQASTKSAADKAAEEDAKRKAHEEAEAKRKAEWEAEQKKKHADELLQIAKVDAMSNDEVLAESMKRISADTEKLTRRQMMECVMEHIQTLCLDDPDFARKVMHPRKNMIRCYQYINRKAWEYTQDEMKAKGITPGRGVLSYSNVIGEEICYQWAVDYFNDPDVQEDHADEEKFVPKPYTGAAAVSPKKAKGKGKSDSKAGGAKGTGTKDAKPMELKKKDDGGQIAFGGFAMPEEKAG